MIIAMQGGAYTGKSFLALNIALKLKCPIISLDDFLDASEPTDEKDTLISNIFNLIARTVKTQLSLGFSVVVDSPLSRLSHLLKLFGIVSTELTHNIRLLIIECKPQNEYAYQLSFEESDSAIYARRWYKPAAVWPLPKVPRDYTDDDIPNGVSKLVVDTNDNYSSCQVLKAMFDVTSCDYGHKTKYSDYWHIIHTDKWEQITCPCPNHKDSMHPNHVHTFIFYEDRGHSGSICFSCEKNARGSYYTCECQITLHESCAELALGGEKHFVPETFPILVSSYPHLRYNFSIQHRCNLCRNSSNGFSYNCENCLFKSHLKSRLVPTVVRHKVHSYYYLTVWFDSNVERSTYRCLACRKVGQFAGYLFSYAEKYHVKCVLLPPSVNHSHCGYTHDLIMITSRVEELEDYMCDCCLTKMDPDAWYYYCSECNISMHLECAFLDFDTGGPILPV